MGHSSKKKKKRGGGAGRRAQSKDHHSIAAADSEILAEELTALCAIFQEDCKIVSESPPQVNIKLRPYSKDTGYEDSDVSALLSVRCVQGYPFRCPKLQIVPERGLSKTDTDNLLSLLYDQANSNAREGRVMIYNLVEAAQEFLSEIIPQGQPHESVVCHDTDKSTQLSQKDATTSSGRISFSGGHFVYGHLDLFCGSGELWQWNLGMEENSKIVPSQIFDSLKTENVSLQNQMDKHMKPSVVQSDKAGHAYSLRLGPLEEESEDETKSDSSSGESVGIGTVGYAKDISVERNLTETDSGDLDSDSESSSSDSAAYDQPQTVERDLLLAHLLRLACAAKGPLGDALPEITSELLNLGILSESVRDMAMKPSSSFDKTFHRVFRKHIGSSTITHFWKTASDFGGQSSSFPSSRYLNDFDELQAIEKTKVKFMCIKHFVTKIWSIAYFFGIKVAVDNMGPLYPMGSMLFTYLSKEKEKLKGQHSVCMQCHGGFGHVVLCKNKLDGRHYAVKKIRLKDKSLPVDDRILRYYESVKHIDVTFHSKHVLDLLFFNYYYYAHFTMLMLLHLHYDVREVATLSRLQHQHVVRYYQAWYETGAVGSDANTAWGSRTGMSSSFSYKDTGSSDQFGNENKLESTYLYIQMEYCPRTLRQMFESYNHLDKELAWHLFRQIVEGLAHIHGQGIIHRDLTPNNIFFDARNDIKIGDFGLAKFLKLEQVDQDVDATETVGVSIDGTGQVGTYFYTAPEIEQGWPKINEKADMYSLGIVFFELWHPFDTAMERHVVLSDLKLKGELPSDWISEFPEQASLLRRLMSPSPSDRPSATELLKSAFPPQMEYELLDILLMWDT
ncbi:UNVERIFIED_CONTAM: eIF-2-alpha kinase GCN2 [Sesamum calycinum]|uniref:EIF-2-alpha kinase GCN2 n=1 Tax=Sesamum calycinum TaxID=2727403 RepID=A0AAW2RRM8_9LAMI